MSEFIYKILVVEDEPIILRDTVQEIENADLGFQVKWTAYNGNDALEIIEKQKPDVVFTDIKMPIMSGMELVENIRKKHPQMPVVMLTGFSEFNFAKQAIQFQVEDYLLKPLEVEELREVLLRIREKLESKRVKNEREILFSKIHGTSEMQPLPFQYENDIFELYLIQLGNLYNYDFPEGVSDQILNVWRNADWGKWMRELRGDKVFWIIDEKKLNQKFLIFNYKRKRPVQDRVCTGESLINKFHGMHPELPVHIFMSDAEIHYQDIWNISSKIRNMVENAKMGDEIRVLEGEAGIDSKWMPADLQTGFSIAMEDGNLTGMRKEVEKVLKCAEELAFSQRQIETEIMSIYKKIKKEDHRENVSVMLSKIRQECFWADKLPYEKIWKLLEAEYLAENSGGNLEIAIKEIQYYIHQHYPENITVAELSKKFHFNGNYLTRIFKKYTNESPMNYLIQTRLDKAVDLMKTRNELDIREISKMVGYEDSHYFSRIFKNKLGKSPSEYRKEILNDKVK